ncbi:hypothetical protein K7432_009833 [Basidiobolus ranarum]|uniref:Uncharacterized protein n=1 Tax=Basidiobolus ranarum TaxID=34480 RepID=A0ABR2VWF2_9FUNG
MDPSSRASSNTLSNAASTTDSEVRPLEPFDTLVDRYFQPNYTKSFKEITAERIASITIVIIKYWIPHYVKDPMKAEELIKILHNNPVLLSAVFETNWDQFDIISHYIKRNYNLSLVENIRIMPDTGALIQSWSANYEDPNDVLPYIYKKLANMCDSWNPNNYYYPGVAAVQTSGAGKSKTFCSLTKLGTYVVYCSFLSVESTGYPKRSPIADTLSAYEHSDQYEAQLSFLAFIAASVDAVTACVDLKIDPATFLRVQIEESDGTHVKPALTQWIRSRYIHHKDILTAFLTSLELETFMKTRMGFVSGKESKREAEPTAVKSKDEMAKPSQRFPKSMHAKRPRDFDINSFPIKTSDNVLDQSVESSMALEVLFVLDETRELLEKTCTQGNLHPVEKESIENELKNDSNLKLPRSRAISVPLFTCMRRAFRWIPKHSRIFAVTLDTTSRITKG